MKKNSDKTAKVLIGASAFGASFFDPDIRWLTQFSAPDRFIAVHFGGKTVLITHDLEYERAKKQARVDAVLLTSELCESLKLQANSPASVWLPAYLKNIGAKRVLLPPFFGLPLALAKSFDVSTPESGHLFDERAVKTEQEIGYIRAVRDATEHVLDVVFRALEDADILDGKIRDTRGTFVEPGEFITAEAVRAFMNKEFVGRGCFCPDAIIASGDQAVDPHCIGFGPLRVNVPIVFDIFPRSMENLYWYDTTRTIVKGKLSAEARRLYGAVKTAQEMGLGEVRAGVNGKKIHNKIVTYFEKLGYKTGLQKAVVEGREVMLMQGFFHGTGHGVGVDIHEEPRISLVNSELKADMVVTVEPGLYYYGVGGVRIEDTVLVTEDGCKNLSRYTKELLEL